MNEILYQVVAVDSDLIKDYPDKVTCISENENMANGIIYNDYDFKNHRYIKSYVSDNFNIYDKYKEQEDKINNLQSKIDKANEILNKLCVMKPWNDSEEEMRKIYRPIKNTSKQEVYKAICDLRDILKEDK